LQGIFRRALPCLLQRVQQLAVGRFAVRLKVGPHNTPIACRNRVLVYGNKPPSLPQKFQRAPLIITVCCSRSFRSGTEKNEQEEEEG
jgi:hypothetical protein